MGQDNNAYPPGTIVFAKLKGYPWWPAKIEDERTVPAKVLKQKSKTKSPIWTVFFFGSRDYGFFGPDSIRPFNKVNVEKDLKAKKFKTKDLEMAVREALDPSLMGEDEEFGEEDGEEEEEEQTPVQEKKRAKATAKNGKKSNATATKSVTPPSTKNTKAASDQEDMDTQSVTKKRNARDDDNADKKKRRKSMSLEKEDQPLNGNDRTSASPVTPRKPDDALMKTPEFKRLYQLRHRLQKLIYEKKPGDIPLDDYPKISQVMKDVEEAPMTYDLLRLSKIGKVVKAGIGYDFGEDTEFSIHERCQQLMKKWKEVFVDSKEQTRNHDSTTTTSGDSVSTLQA